MTARSRSAQPLMPALRRWLLLATLPLTGAASWASRGRGCLALMVNNFNPLPSLRASDFVQLDGPACGSGPSCPDFSSSGAPLRFGFERRVGPQAGVPAGAISNTASTTGRSASGAPRKVGLTNPLKAQGRPALGSSSTSSSTHRAWQRPWAARA